MRHGRILLAMGLAMLSGPTLALQFNVDTVEDAVDATPGDGLCATAAGACTLRAAVMEANALAGADRIALPPGTYRLSLTGRNEDAAVSGDLDITDELAISGEAAATTLIEGAGDRLVDVFSPAAVSLTGLTLRNGGGVSNGGAIRNAGVLALQACVLEDNGDEAGSVSFGGAVSNIGALTLTGCVLRNNTVNPASSLPGAGGAIQNLGILAINASRFEGNRARLGGSVGGALIALAPGVVQIAGSQFIDNSAISAGALSINGGTVFINSSAVVGNQALGGGTPGAGIGGGLLINQATVTIVNSTLSGNDAAQDGGGIQLFSGELDLRNVTLSDNGADADGNGGGDGGGLNVVGGTATARNSVLAGNRDGGGDLAPDCAGALASEGYLWVLDPTGCTLGAADGDVNAVDPQLLPLADNGGNTLTHNLREGSPLIDAGDPAGCLGNSFDAEQGAVDVPLVSDQRLRLRPVDGNEDEVAVCDPGALEFISDRIFYDGYEAAE